MRVTVLGSFSVERGAETVRLPPGKPAPSLTLGSSIAAGIVSGLAGAIFGSAALSTAFLIGADWHVASLLPLVAAGVCILGDVTVGAGSVVGANSVVVRSVPPQSTVFGVPARPVALAPEK